MRKIPGTMATQHPDNASAPYWDKSDSPFVGVHQEITEALACFEDLGVSEYMWDWEGKHADAAVIDRMFSDHYDYFSKHQIGRDKFLTFRIPNIWEEKGYNLQQALTVILSSEDLARDLKLDERPLFEVILPMTERADQLTHVQELFEKLAKFKSGEFTADQAANTSHLEMIPLVESVESQLGVADLLEEYVALHDKHFGSKPKYIRPFLAGSDSALSSGLLAGLLGNKIALARLYEFAAKTGVAVYPIFGFGSLHFRGGLAPTKISIDRFLKEFPGVRTVTVQSAFRYDYPEAEVKAAIARLESDLPSTKPLSISAANQKTLEAIASRSAKLYKQTLDSIIPEMQPIFADVPKRRDRRQHIGLLAYSREMGGQKLPRAITFTAGFYSVGVPPEFIGLGRTLESLTDVEAKVLNKTYPSLAADYEAAGRYLNLENLKAFAEDSAAWREVLQDVTAAKSALGIELGPETKDERQHYDLAAGLKDSSSGASALIEQMAKLRRSLG